VFHGISTVQGVWFYIGPNEKARQSYSMPFCEGEHRQNPGSDNKARSGNL